MKALKDMPAQFDRISTRAELHQVLDVLMDLKDQRVHTARPLLATSFDLEGDSGEASATYWEDVCHEGSALTADMRALSQLFPEELERIN